MVAQGWCPSTYRIYEAPDGGLARVKVPGGILRTGQVDTLALVARRFGNGTIEITNRANLQLRGIDRADAADLRSHLAAVGLSAPSAEIEDRRNVLASPTAGLATDDDCDQGESIDVRPAIAAAVVGLDGLTGVSDLAHKFGVLIDGGGTPTLRTIALDLSLGAVRLADHDEVVFTVALGEALDAVDSNIGVAATPSAVSAVVAAAARLCAAPPRGVTPGRMADVVRALGLDEAVAELGRSAPIQAIGAPRDPSRAEPSAVAPLGIHGGDGTRGGWVGLRGRETTLSAGHLAALVEVAEVAGVTEVRLTPWRTIILAELSTAAAAEAVKRLAPFGWTATPLEAPVESLAGPRTAQ